MAKNTDSPAMKPENNPAVPQGGTQDAKKQDPKPNDGKYSVADLAGAARTRFGATPELVTVALQAEGKTEATVSEAEAIIKKFMERKVQ